MISWYLCHSAAESRTRNTLVLRMNNRQEKRVDIGKQRNIMPRPRAKKTLKVSVGLLQPTSARALYQGTTFSRAEKQL